MRYTTLTALLFIVITSGCEPENYDSYTVNVKKAIEERKPLVDEIRSRKPRIDGVETPEKAVFIALYDILNQNSESKAVLNKEEFINEYWPRLENKRVYDPGMTPEFLWNLHRKNRSRAHSRIQQNLQIPFQVISVEYKPVPVDRYGMNEYEIEKVIVRTSGKTVILEEFFTLLEINGRYKITGYGV